MGGTKKLLDNINVENCAVVGGMFCLPQMKKYKPMHRFLHKPRLMHSFLHSDHKRKKCFSLNKKKEWEKAFQALFSTRQHFRAGKRFVFPLSSLSLSLSLFFIFDFSIASIKCVIYSPSRDVQIEITSSFEKIKIKNSRRKEEIAEEYAREPEEHCDFCSEKVKENAREKKKEER